MNLLRKIHLNVTGTTALNTLFFILYFLYLWQVVDLRLIYHDGGSCWDFPVFYTGWEFFRKFLTRPGGLASYISAFLAQLLFAGWAGALVATLQAWLLWLCTGTILRVASRRRLLPVSFAGPILLVIFYSHYFYPFIYEHYVYPFEIATGLLIALAAVCFYMMTASRAGPMNLAFFAALSIIVYAVAGGEYLLFAVICGLYELFFRRRPAIAMIFLAAPLTAGYAASEFFSTPAPPIPSMVLYRVFGEAIQLHFRPFTPFT